MASPRTMNLLGAIYEHPEDDDARLVYADALTQAGDLRGEFIVLQFQRRDGTITPAGVRREKALLKSHGAAWLGPLSPFVRLRSVRFERGFLAAARLSGDSLTELTDPAWSTLETLDLNAVSLSAPATRGLVAAPSLRALTSILGAPPGLFGLLDPKDSGAPGALIARLTCIGGRGDLNHTWLDHLLSLLRAAPRLAEIHWYGSTQSAMPLFAWALREHRHDRLARLVHASPTPDGIERVVALEHGTDGRLDRLRFEKKGATPTAWPDIVTRLRAIGPLREVVTDAPAGEALAATCAKLGVAFASRR